MEFWISTTNKGKLSEFKLGLGGAFPDIQIHAVSEIPAYQAPPENGTTFLDNARIKARSLKAIKPEAYVLADDSGLEVKGLGGLPGIHSARYAGPHARDSENVAKLLKMLQIRNITDRSAKFVCTLVVLTPEKEEWVFQGEMSGVIAKNVAGQHGFGYDPVFIPDGQTQTLAELGLGFKNQHCHRAKALAGLIEKLKT